MSANHVQLHHIRWQVARRAVFARDGYRCTLCGRAGRLEADHIVPLDREPGQDPYDPDGLQTLCRTCHIQKTRRENRREPTPAEAEWKALVAEIMSEAPLT